MSDLSIKYKNNEIATLSSSGTKTIKTKGKYCEDDITIVYEKQNGIDTSDANATINDLLLGKTAYVNGEKITGVLPVDYLSGNLSIEKGTITSGSDGYAYISLENKPLFMFFTDYHMVSGLTSYAGFDTRNDISFHSSLAVNGISTLVQICVNISDNNIQVALLDNNARNPIPNKDLSYISIYDGIQVYNTEEKTVTPTESVQEITPTSADGLSKVTVEAISSSYVGTGVARVNETTINPTESEQIAVASNTYTTGDVKIGAISNTYVGSGITRKSATTISPTESVQTAVASGVYTTGDVNIGAISTTYVGSGVSKRTSSDLTVSGATVTVPAGYYASQATKSVATGTAGTPSASKGTVRNNQVSVTPSVTNTTGYITGGTKNGTAVTVSASELVSGTLTLTANGTSDCTNYKSVTVNVPAYDGSVS